jgi:hypothetical protein
MTINNKFLWLKSQLPSVEDEIAIQYAISGLHRLTSKSTTLTDQQQFEDPLITMTTTNNQEEATEH